MCGISGFVDRRLADEEARHVLSQMVKSQAHRGPDDFGTENPTKGVWFGHNRLSIIDLSSDGHQPMARNHLTITYNGEIYNYLEIKTELESLGYRFTSKSDTEVILYAYAQWGTGCVERFRGMWAFAIWDESEKTLFCSRDRFGIKPFHYVCDDESVYFSSEIKALKYSRLYSSELNPFQLMRDIQLGWSVYSDETHYLKIKQLRPGENLIFKAGKLSLIPYYRLIARPMDRGETNLSMEFRNRFFDSIRLHMRADVEVGSTFSGGIDSSAVVCAVQHIYHPDRFQTFTVWYEQADERPFASQVWKMYPSIVHHTLQPDTSELSEAYIRATRQYDIPVSGSSYLSQYFVMKYAHQCGIKVLLDGQGSDEYLMGYLHSLYRLFATYLRRGSVAAFVRELFTFSKMQHWKAPKVADLVFKSLLSTFLSEHNLYKLEYHHFYPNAFRGGEDTPFFLPIADPEPLRNFSWHLIYSTILQTLLMHEDRNSMAFSIEARVPFLDHLLVEFGFSAPLKEKISNGYTKHILRKALSDIMPDNITWRIDKKGFVTPGEVIWLRNQLRWLLDESMELPGIDARVWKQEKKKFLTGNDKNARWIWRVASANYWYKTLNVS